MLNKTEFTDVVIIGAGASGAAAAWNLSRKNIEVTCIEQGAYIDTNKYPSTSIDWELRKYSDYSVSPNIRKLPSDYPINDSNSPISIANYNAVGGSTILYSGHFPRFHPSDFKVKTFDDVAEDWPIDYDILEPYYNLNDKMMGVSGLTDDPAYPEIKNLLPPVPIGPGGEKIVKGFNKLGWHIWPSYSAIITRPFGGREKCINLGPCNTGCVQRAKSSVDVTYWPQALQKGVKLKTNSRVKNIETDKNGKISGVHYFNEMGEEKFIFAEKIILACNGVGTPRLLLNSKNKLFPNGLANSSGLVGKNLMLHPLGYVEGNFKENIDSHIGPQGCCVYSHEFYESDRKRGFIRGFTMQILRGPSHIETALSGYNRRKISTGINHHNDFSKLFGKTMGMGIIVEDLPDPSNCVELDSNVCDSNGIPAPKIKYRLSDNSKKMLSFGINRGKEAFKVSGATSVSGFGPIRNSGWHLMGTAKMGTDPKHSVVNELGECHDVENLYVVDSSIFVTSGGVNPASTLQALALYITDNIQS